MKIVYIAHPIGGNEEANLRAIRNIVKMINYHEPDTVPFVPYYADVVSMSDSIPWERQRGIKNDIEILSRKGIVDELRLYGPTISAGMRLEIIAALNNKIPVVSTTDSLHTELEHIKSYAFKTGELK